MIAVEVVRNGHLSKEEEVEVYDTVQRQVQHMVRLIDEAEHQLTVNLPDEPFEIDGDAVRLSQIVANLLNNAAKYTPDGGRIDLTVSALDDQVEIRVKDNGIGIPPELIPDVFGMFQQIDQHLDLSKGGLGIGLTLVKRLVEMHQGQIEVESAGEGKGREFIVRLPLAGKRKPPIETTTSP
ncbi:sensor histidine kinase [Blastopirellula retiformator]|uniref:histidine kinase n=1 Tax=Blastopirellula retiformator TaxID=2527970 RepID=A0A5C5V6K1_9BACT|nr:ATP-binding protein [Blastopirellula retiformator]TWT34188.1 Alkaline phosphatase synthesis sensor protein PhoR [Blastopirellula retiformator]